MLKGLYLCARKHRINMDGVNIIYNDIIDYDGIDIVYDCCHVDLTGYDFIICTPPCNYYSIANYRREKSKVALDTKDILPTMLDKLVKLKIPFIVENVVNWSLLPHRNVYVFDWGKHTFYSNLFFFPPDKDLVVKQNKAHVCVNKRNDNENVDIVLKTFIQAVIDFYHWFGGVA